METLKERLAKLPKDAPLKDVFKAMTEWEHEAVKWQQGAEARVLRDGLSGRIHPICPFHKVRGSASTNARARG